MGIRDSMWSRGGVRGMGWGEEEGFTGCGKVSFGIPISCPFVMPVEVLLVFALLFCKALEYDLFRSYRETERLGFREVEL
jgi:hypothetical protein